MIRILVASVIIALVFFLALVISAHGVTLTHYAYPGDSYRDPGSAAGIGNHNNPLTPMASAAVSADVAQANGLVLGQSFSITTTDGRTLNLIYDDSPRGDLTGRIDVYDPNNALGAGNDFSANIASINNGPVLMGNGVTGTGNFSHANTPAFVDALLQKFQNAGHGWVGVIQRAATSLFWILATISVCWTVITLLLKRADLMEICAELCRFIMTTGIFFWLLTNGPDFAGKIIASLWQLGGQASGSGNEIYPGDLISLGMQVLVNSTQHINWVLLAPAAGIPALFAVVILIICALIAVNMILLLCAAWVVLYAGIIFLGFGGCRWTSDMAINYYRTVLGIGVSLLVMQLVIGIGAQFLQSLVAATGQNPDIPGMATIMVACIIIAVLAHRLPMMVANIAVGSGHHGGIGALGFMSVIGASMAASSIARGIGGGAVAAGMSAHEKLMERMGVLEAAGSNGNGSVSPTSRPPIQSFSVQAPSSSPTTSTASSSRNSTPTTTIAASDEPPLEKPVSPDAQRGFEPPSDWVYPDEPV
jgi:type IV secretion system protein TrbL